MKELFRIGLAMMLILLAASFGSAFAAEEDVELIATYDSSIVCDASSTDCVWIDENKSKNDSFTVHWLSQQRNDVCGYIVTSENYDGLNVFCVDNGDVVWISDTKEDVNVNTLTISAYQPKVADLYVYAIDNSGQLIRIGYAIGCIGKPEKDCFTIAKVDESAKKIYFKSSELPQNAKIEYRLKKADGTSVVTKEGDEKSKAFSFEKNQGYKYQIRVVYYGKEKSIEPCFGPWSAYNYFSDTTAKLTDNTAKRGCQIRITKGNSISKYKIYVSTKKNSGYKLTVTVANPMKSNYKTVNLSKIGSSTMKKGKTYYVKVVPVVKSGDSSYKSDIFAQTSFYCYR